MSPMMMLAPWEAHSRAKAAPMPRAPPVMRTVLDDSADGSYGFVVSTGSDKPVVGMRLWYPCATVMLGGQAAEDMDLVETQEGT